MDNNSKDWFYSSDEFQQYFKNGTRSMLLKANPPHFIILAVSDTFLAQVQKERSELLNRELFEAFPENEGDPSDINNRLQQLQTAIQEKKLTERTTFKYDIYKAETGNHETEYWTNSDEPILNEDGEVAYIINTTTNVTQQILQQQAVEEAGKLKDSLLREQSLNDELAATVEEIKAVNDELHDSQNRLYNLKNELEERVEKRTHEIKNSEWRFRSLVEQLPVAINVFLTQDLIVDLPNDRMLEIWGRSFNEVAGKPLTVGMPELEGQPFIQRLRDVIATGIPYASSEEKAVIQRNNKLVECYFDIVYQPIVNEDGTITSCLQIASEVTEAVFSRSKIQMLNEELATINEEMSSTNEELAAANEELASASEEQSEINKQLADAILQSEIQRERLNTFFMQAPAGICVFGGSDFLFELVNPAYQKLLPGRSLLGRPIFEALPELTGTFLQDVLPDVYRNGKEITFTEMLIPLGEYEGGPMQDRYFTFHFMPRKNENGETDGILNFVYEVTEEVAARKKVEEAEEGLRIATESADLGTWSYYVSDNKLAVSPRFKEIFGVAADEEFTNEEKLAAIHPEYQPAVITAMQTAAEEGAPLNIEYPITECKEGKQKWIRAVGKRVKDGDSGVYLTGVVADITEQKRDEQRKNDFIGMVSHEMKTPLTSLSGYLQLLQMRAADEDGFAATMLGKANKQISKMTNLINGFLNVSRLESGKIQINKQRFDMAVLVKEEKEEVLSMYNTHRIHFAPVEETFVNADRDKIGQVINNLISNAVKYSPANTTIKVDCKTVDGAVVFSVTDEGIGIKEEDKEKLFERYYRVNNDNATSASGFGIGLYLCAEIIQRHDGKIWVESLVGKGSAFSFTLPVVS